MSTAEILVAIAQVAAGGTIVQGIVALVRRRSELRKLDRESESVAIDTADRMIVMLRRELEASRSELERAGAERDDLRRQLTLLGDDVAKLRTDLVSARAEINRLKEGSHG